MFQGGRGVSPVVSRPRAARLLSLCVVSLLLSGCVFQLREPDMRIVSATIVEETPEGVVVNVEIEGANRTPKDLALRSVHYWMELDGERVFVADRSPQTTFSALGVKSFKTPVAIPREALPNSDIASYRVGATVWYLIPGPLPKALFDIGLLRPSVSAVGIGELDLRPAQPVAGQTSRPPQPAPEQVSMKPTIARPIQVVDSRRDVDHPLALAGNAP